MREIPPSHFLGARLQAEESAIENCEEIWESNETRPKTFEVNVWPATDPSSFIKSPVTRNFFSCPGLINSGDRNFTNSPGFSVSSRYSASRKFRGLNNVSASVNSFSRKNQQPSISLPQLRYLSTPEVHPPSMNYLSRREESESQRRTARKCSNPFAYSKEESRPQKPRPKIPDLQIPDLASYKSTVDARTQKIVENQKKLEQMTADIHARDQAIKQRLPQFMSEIRLDIPEARIRPRIIPERLKLLDVDRRKAKEIINCNPSVVIIDKFNIEIRGREISCLNPTNWLNDEVINFYFEMLNERSKQSASLVDENQMVPKAYGFSTFFFAKLCPETDCGIGYRYSDVQRWTKRKKIDIFSFNILLFPVHIGKIHWALGVVDVTNRVVRFFDSLGGSFGSIFHQNITRYLEDEHRDKKGELSSECWSFQPDRLPPQQDNGWDCGVFTCQYGERVSVGESFDFTQGDIENCRLKMALQIAQGEL